jgi:hypothetical protein
MLRVATDAQAQDEPRLDLDQLVREAPGGCGPPPWRPRSTPTWPRMPPSAMRAAGGWWWCRKSPKVAEVLPLLYLHGPSTGDFVPALAAFFGSAAGLSASV